MNARIFAGVYPAGIVYADRHRQAGGDYKRLAFLDFATLRLDMEKDCHSDLAKEIRADAETIQNRRGQPYQTSTTGQGITLGYGADNLAAEAYSLGSTAFRAGRQCVPAHDAELMRLLETHKQGQPEGWTIPIFQAWSRAWHAANARQGVPTS